MLTSVSYTPWPLLPRVSLPSLCQPGSASPRSAPIIPCGSSVVSPTAPSIVDGQNWSSQNMSSGEY